MSKVTTKDVDLINLHEWATANLHNLETAEAIRKTAGIVYPQDIELQLRNLKEAYHKISLMCKEKVSAEVGFRPIYSKQVLGVDYGTPPNKDEWAIYARQHVTRAEDLLMPVQQQPADLGNQDWSGANPSFNPHAGE